MCVHDEGPPDDPTILHKGPICDNNPCLDIIPEKPVKPKFAPGKKNVNLITMVVNLILPIDGVLRASSGIDERVKEYGSKLPVHTAY